MIIKILIFFVSIMIKCKISVKTIKQRTAKNKLQFKIQFNLRYSHLQVKGKLNNWYRSLHFLISHKSQIVQFWKILQGHHIAIGSKSNISVLNLSLQTKNNIHKKKTMFTRSTLKKKLNPNFKINLSKTNCKYWILK